MSHLYQKAFIQCNTHTTSGPVMCQATPRYRKMELVKDWKGRQVSLKGSPKKQNIFVSFPLWQRFSLKFSASQCGKYPKNLELLHLTSWHIILVFSIHSKKLCVAVAMCVCVCEVKEEAVPQLNLNPLETSHLSRKVYNRQAILFLVSSSLLTPTTVVLIVLFVYYLLSLTQAKTRGEWERKREKVVHFCHFPIPIPISTLLVRSSTYFLPLFLFCMRS